jgi:hypothetical protein
MRLDPLLCCELEKARTSTDVPDACSCGTQIQRCYTVTQPLLLLLRLRAETRGTSLHSSVPGWEECSVRWSDRSWVWWAVRRDYLVERPEELRFVGLGLGLLLSRPAQSIGLDMLSAAVEIFLVSGDQQGIRVAGVSCSS